MPLLQWHIKSTTKAQQGLYEYDAVSRLRDSQLGDARVSDIRNYIKRGKLWEAFTSDERPVLLIDEIDKADIEFPNDLLQELDRMTRKQPPHPARRQRRTPLLLPAVLLTTLLSPASAQDIRGMARFSATVRNGKTSRPSGTWLNPSLTMRSGSMAWPLSSQAPRATMIFRPPSRVSMRGSNGGVSHRSSGSTGCTS